MEHRPYVAIKAQDTYHLALYRKYLPISDIKGMKQMVIIWQPSQRHMLQVRVLNDVKEV